MTNEEKYTTVEDRVEEFVKFCTKSGGCTYCTIRCNFFTECTFTWLTLEAEESNKEEKLHLEGRIAGLDQALDMIRFCKKDPDRGIDKIKQYIEFLKKRLAKEEEEKGEKKND